MSGQNGRRRAAVLRTTIQALVSAAAVAVIIYIARETHVLETLRAIDGRVAAAALAIWVAANLINGLRWRVLLGYQGITLPASYLIPMYFIGLFFSLFLPSSAGGDVVRAINVAQKSQKPAATAAATLQERLIGLVASLLFGLLATVIYLRLLPAEVRLAIVFVQLGLGAVIVLALYPAFVIKRLSALYHTLRLPDLRANRLGQSIGRIIAGVSALPNLRLGQLLVPLALAICSSLLTFWSYSILGSSFGIDLAYSAYWLVIPLVFIIRLLPISLGGIGIGEGAFVFLMGLFAVAADQSLALAVTVLAIQTVTALLGGATLLVFLARGAWVRPGGKATTEAG